MAACLLLARIQLARKASTLVFNARFVLRLPVLSDVDTVQTDYAWYSDVIATRIPSLNTVSVPVWRS